MIARFKGGCQITELRSSEPSSRESAVIQGEDVRVMRGTEPYDVSAMQAEVEIARRVSEFDEGPYKNAISLPSVDQIYQPYKEHKNNVPFSAALDQCPYFKSIFDSFETEKAAFRLLRRLPQSAYAFHDDKDRGREIARFQIPINTSEHAFLLIAENEVDLRRFDTDSSGFKGDSNSDVWFNMEELHDACADDVELFYLEAGYVNYFDTDRVHTLINAELEERVTLSFDLVMNDWLVDWMKTHLTHVVSPSPIKRARAVTWKWNALRHGIIRTD
jgi:hypothetical protein